jgi:hypothetical protein
MSHINYNHLYYFWHVYKEGSVVGAAEALSDAADHYRANQSAGRASAGQAVQA